MNFRAGQTIQISAYSEGEIQIKIFFDKRVGKLPPAC